MSGRIEVTPEVWINETEIELSFVGSSGPGGQKVNRTSSAVQLFFDISSSSLPEEVKNRLRKQFPGRISKDDVLMIESSEHRSQHRNRETAVSRLVKILRKACRKPKRRKRTKPPRRAREKRLAEKKKRSQKKKLRQDPDPGRF
ncbi:aminoacyl-tRNA hydrolase [Candidatus Fermentibacteria bacterium]|nr:aminoacyl-tRNA hydrolase [Candidatus Fermentibacteria bacterium]